VDSRIIGFCFLPFVLVLGGEGWQYHHYFITSASHGRQSQKIIVAINYARPEQALGSKK